MHIKKEIIGCILIGLGVIIFMWTLYLNSVNPNTPIIFSKNNMLQNIWRNYKNTYIEEETGRTVDRQQSDITTSEGISYTMLRSVWMDDKETFDRTFNWANENLKRTNDALYSWLFGKRSDGSYGVLVDRGGINTAADGDTDIALSLIFAYKRWGDESYLIAAKKIIADIWKLDVVSIHGIPYLTADDLERFSKKSIVVNPSYFSPATYRIFARYDTVNPWLLLVDSSYALLTKSTQERLDTSTSASLPPDWITLDRETGLIIPTITGTQLTTRFSYDALRIPWRITLDYMWFGHEESRTYLSKLGFLETEWKTKGTLAAAYTHDGSRFAPEETAAMYAGTLGYFMTQDPISASEIYTRKLLFLYDPDTNNWKTQLGYYDDNMVWFALAMYNDLLPNLNEK